MRVIIRMASFLLYLLSISLLSKAPMDKVKKPKNIKVLKKDVRLQLKILEQKGIGLRESNAKQIIPVECSTPTVWWVRGDQLNNAISDLINGQPIQSTNVDKVLQPVDFEKGTSQEGDFEKSDVLYIPIICWDGDRAVSLAAPDFDPFKGQNCPSIETRIRAFDWQGNTIPHKYSFIGEDGDVQEEELPADVVPYYESYSRFIRLSALFATPECDVEAEKEFPEVFNIFVPYILINFYLHGTPPNDLAGFPRAPFENFYSVDFGGSIKVEITNPSTGIVKVNGTDDMIPSTPFRVEGPVRIVREATSTSSVTHSDLLKISISPGINITSVTSSDSSILSISGTNSISLTGNNSGTATISIKYTKPNMPAGKSLYEVTFVKVYVFLSPVEELRDQIQNATWFDFYLILKTVQEAGIEDINPDEPPFLVPPEQEDEEEPAIISTEHSKIILEQQQHRGLNPKCKSSAAVRWNAFLRSHNIRLIPSQTGNEIIISNKYKTVYDFNELEPQLKDAIQKSHNFAKFDFDPAKAQNEREFKRNPRLEEDNVLKNLLKWQSCWESEFNPLAFSVGGTSAVGLLQITDASLKSKYENKKTKQVANVGLLNTEYNFQDIQDLPIFKNSAPQFLAVCKLFNESFNSIKSELGNIKDLTQEKIDKILKDPNSELNKFLNTIKYDPRITLPQTAYMIGVNYHRMVTNVDLIKSGSRGFKGFDTSDIILPYLNADITKLRPLAGNNLDLPAGKDTNVCLRIVNPPASCDDNVIARQVLGVLYNQGRDKVSGPGKAIFIKGNKTMFDINKLQGTAKTYSEKAGSLNIAGKKCPKY